MRNRRRSALMAAVFSLGMTVFAVPAAYADTLAQAIAMAYESNPSFLQARSVLRNADETYFRASRALGPTVSSTVTVSGSGTQSFLPGGGGSTSGSVRAGISVDQTLFAGGRLRATILADEASLLSARETFRQQEATLVQSVFNAYTGVLRAEQSLEIAKLQVTVLTKQRDEAQARFTVGTQTRTDLAQAESRLQASNASLTSAQNTLDNARAQYRTVVGQYPTNLAPLPDITKILPMSVGQAFDVARQNNPTLRRAYLTEQASAARASAARAARRPSVSAGVDYGYSDALPHGFDSSGVSGSITLSVPLYPGLTTGSSIRSADENNLQDRIAIDGQIRSLEQDVTQFWNALQAARQTIVAQELAYKAAELAAEGVRAEQENGLRSTVELLNSEQELRQAQQNLVNARFSAATAEVNLLNAMGQLKARVFAADLEEYDPLKHFNDVNGFGLPWESLIRRLDNLGAAPIRERPLGPNEQAPVIEPLRPAAK